MASPKKFNPFNRLSEAAAAAPVKLTVKYSCVFYWLVSNTDRWHNDRWEVAIPRDRETKRRDRETTPGRIQCFVNRAARAQVRSDTCHRGFLFANDSLASFCIRDARRFFVDSLRSLRVCTHCQSQNSASKWNVSTVCRIADVWRRTKGILVFCQVGRKIIALLMSCNFLSFFFSEVSTYICWRLSNFRCRK